MEYTDLKCKFLLAFISFCLLCSAKLILWSMDWIIKLKATYLARRLENQLT